MIFYLIVLFLGIIYILWNELKNKQNYDDEDDDE